MPRELSEHIGDVLTQRVQDGADSACLAAEVVGVWRQIEGVLAPILGRRGVTTLFKRTLSLTAARLPWLAVVDQPSSTGIALDALRLACAAQTPAVIAEGGQALLESFHALLSSLIGASLTAQLLSPVTVTPLHDASRTPDHEQ
jgi:hypothetical protein